MCLFGQRKTDEAFGTKDTVNTALWIFPTELLTGTFK